MANDDKLYEVGKSINWLYLLGRNGWHPDFAKSYDEEYSFYGCEILGSEYFVKCWARVSDKDDGFGASGDWGVAWVECDVSTYTSQEYLGRNDAQEIISSIDHAEINLLKCGIPFTHGYRFSGRNAANKAKSNEAIRKKLGLAKEGT